MSGVYGGITIDVEWWTSESESSPRQRTITVLQPHHTASTSLQGSRGLMDPGGREVSANGLLDIDGTLYGVVVPWRRAFTSATTFDHDSFTVECVNSSGDPTWGLTDAQHRRLGKLAAEIAALNGRTPGADMIVQHRDVPGTYATACAGPSYNGALVLQYALEPLSPSKPKGLPMFAIFREASTGWIFAVGEDGRRAPIQNEKQFTALRRLRDAMLYTGDKVEEFYLGDFTDSAWGDLDRILNAINGPRTATPPPAPTWAPTPAELAAIGAAAKPDISALVREIDKLAEADKAELLAAINKPRTGTIS